MSDITSRPFRPDPAKCCERCVFNGGNHADWCEIGKEETASKLPGYTPIGGCSYQDGLTYFRVSQKEAESWQGLDRVLP